MSSPTPSQCAAGLSSSPSTGIVGQNTLLDLLASAAAYTPARDFLNHFQVSLAVGNNGASHRPPQVGGGKVPQVGSADAASLAVRQWGARQSDIHLSSGENIMSGPCMYPSAGIQSLGKRDGQQERVDAGGEGAMAVDRILAGPDSDLLSAAAKRARIEEIEPLRVEGASSQMQPSSGPVLPPIRMMSLAADGAAGAGMHEAECRADLSSPDRVALPSAGPRMPGGGGEPLMPLSLALWPRAGGAGGGVPAGAPRLLPLSRLDHSATACGPVYPAAPAAVGGSL